MGLREIAKRVIQAFNRKLDEVTGGDPYPLTREEFVDQEQETQRERADRWLRDNNEA